MKRTLSIIVVLAAAGIVFGQGMELTSARLYKKQGEWLKAIDFYGQALAKDSTLLEAYFERGEMYKDIAADSSKIGLAQHLAGDNPDPQKELYDRMSADFDQAVIPRTDKDEGTAKKLAKKIDRILDERWDHFYFVAVQLDSMYARAKADNVTDPDPNIYLQNALGELDMAIKMRSGKWNAYGMKGQIYEKLDDIHRAAVGWAEAVERIKAAVKLKRETDEYQQGLAICLEHVLVDLYNDRDYPTAIKTADELHELDSLNAHAVQLKADALCRMAESDSISTERRTELRMRISEAFYDVMTTADAILQQDSTNIEAIRLKANALAHLASDSSLSENRRNELRQAALSALNRALVWNPNDPDIIYTIGQFDLQVGDTAGAINAFLDYLKIHPDDREVLFALGVIYLEGGTYADNKKARGTFEKLTEYYPDYGAAWTDYGIALIRLGENEKGREAIEKGKSLSN